MPGNGITQGLTKPRSPTTTGKIERSHRALREEFLDHVMPFESLAAAQEAIDGLVRACNHQRPHQALNMATPISLFRPHTAVRGGDEHPEQDVTETELSIEVVEPPVPPPQGTAIVDVRVPPSGEITLVTGRQRVGIHQALAGRTPTVWANHRSVRFLLDGHLVTPVASRLRPEDLAYLTMRYGARPAGPEPAPAALPRARSGTAILASGEPVEVARKVHRDGILGLAGGRYPVGFALAGRTITLRLDGHVMHAIADNALMGTWPCPVPADRLGQIQGARTATSPLPTACC
ncbi:integrase core domain-containing protein [Streptomyces chartreusis]|uniref:integrase core domain-containing protein n=1 Tax=Streptomyces chartreusis TaxID=1969 RepID=UPI00382BD29F